MFNKSVLNSKSSVYIPVSNENNFRLYYSFLCNLSINKIYLIFSIAISSLNSTIQLSPMNSHFFISFPYFYVINSYNLSIYILLASSILSVLIKLFFTYKNYENFLFSTFNVFFAFKCKYYYKYR